jgi:hypothetical protein
MLVKCEKIGLDAMHASQSRKEAEEFSPVAFRFR